MLSSGCTGWDPNVAEIAVADSIMCTCKTIGYPCTGPDADKTFYAQSTYVQPVIGKKDAYIAMFDRWKKKDLEDSRYVWFPIATYLIFFFISALTILILKYNEKMDDIVNPGLASQKIKLEYDEYFVIGDNWNSSEDSRSNTVGNVKLSEIKGKVWLISWPFASIKIVK